MKIRWRYILAGVFIVFTTASCNDWLNVTSSSQIRAEDQFESEAGFKDALMGVYLGMTSTESYGKDMSWYMVDILSQQYLSLQNFADYYEIQEYEYETTSGAAKVDAVWSKSYNIIANINNILQYIDENQDVLSTYDRDLIKGELLGLRAFLYFDLLRLFGRGNLDDQSRLPDELTVPYVTEYSKEIPPRRSYEETFALLNQDIEEALELLKSDPIYDTTERPEGYEETVGADDFYVNRKVRMNYYALKALQARVLIWQGGTENMDEARLAAEEVINNAPVHLIDSETYSVGADPVLHPEILFSLDIDAFEDIVNPFLNGASLSTNGNDNAILLSTNTTNDIYETDNVNIGPPDIRYNTLLEEQTRGFVSLKLLQSDDVSSQYGNTVPLIKLPEMYYIAAEYYINAGQLSTAIQYLNTVRTSRGIVQQIPADATQEELENELFKEYRKEYVSEGQLFYYYKRLGLENFPGLSSDVTADEDIYVLPYPDSENIFR